MCWLDDLFLVSWTWNRRRPAPFWVPAVQHKSCLSLWFDWIWLSCVLSIWCCSPSTKLCQMSAGGRFPQRPEEEQQEVAAASARTSCQSVLVFWRCYLVLHERGPTESLGLMVKFRPRILAAVTLTFFRLVNYQRNWLGTLLKLSSSVCVRKFQTFRPFLRTSQVVCISWSVPPGLYFLTRISWCVPPGLYFLVCNSWSVSSGLYFMICSSWTISPGLYLQLCSSWSVTQGQHQSPASGPYTKD